MWLCINRMLHGTRVRGGMSDWSMMKYEDNNPMNIDFRKNDQILRNTHTHTNQSLALHCDLAQLFPCQIAPCEMTQ